MKTKKASDKGETSNSVKKVIKKRRKDVKELAPKVDLPIVDKISNDEEFMDVNEIKTVSCDLPKDNSFLTAFVHFPKTLNELKLKQFLNSHKISYEEIRFVKKRRMCYIDFNIENDLMKFISLDKSKISDVELTIKRANKKFDISNSKVSKSEEKDSRRLFMKNLPYELAEDEVHKIFPTATDVKMPRRSDNRLKGYGYLEFPDERVASEVLLKLQNVVVGGRAVKLSKIMHKEKVEKVVAPRPNVPTCLLVKQLSFAVTKEMLKKMFKKSISTRIVHDPKTKKSQGYGFVEFENKEDAKNAMKEMQGRELDGRKMVITAALKKLTPSRTEKKAHKMKGKEETKKKPKGNNNNIDDVDDDDE